MVATPLLGTYLRDSIQPDITDTCVLVHTAAFPTVAKSQTAWMAFNKGNAERKCAFHIQWGRLRLWKSSLVCYTVLLAGTCVGLILIQQECYKQKQRTMAALRNTRWYFRRCIYESNLMPQNVLSKCETIKDNLTISTKCNWGPCCMVSTNSSLSEYLYYANIIQK